MTLTGHSPLRRRGARQKRASNPILLSILICTVAVGLLASQAETGDLDRVDLRVSKADGFAYRDLKSSRPIVMFPVSPKIADFATAKRLSSALDDQAESSRFISPNQVQKVLQNRYLSSGFDSLVTTLSTVQPAESFSVLSTVANNFSARHALVPVDVIIDNSNNRYTFDVMFVLVDMESGSPCLVMSATDWATEAKKDEVESLTFQAILRVLRQGT